MEKFQIEFAERLADSKGNPLFFGKGLRLKDGRQTPYFVNIGGFFETASGITAIGRWYSGMMDKIWNIAGPFDIVSGPSYKASAIAQSAVMSLYDDYAADLGFNYDRKEAKAHGEASGKGTMFVGAKFFNDCNVLIVDDVGTSMQTKVEFIDKIQREASGLEIIVNINAVLIGVDREQVGPVYKEGYDPKIHSKENENWVVEGARGEDSIAKFTNQTKIPVYSVIGINDVMAHLLESKRTVPFKNEDGSFKRIKVTESFLEDNFYPYMEMYGADRMDK